MGQLMVTPETYFGNMCTSLPHTHTLLVTVLGEFCATRGTHTHTFRKQTASLRHHQQGSSDAEPVQAQQSEQCRHAATHTPRLADTSGSERNVWAEGMSATDEYLPSRAAHQSTAHCLAAIVVASSRSTQDFRGIFRSQDHQQCRSTPIYTLYNTM